MAIIGILNTFIEDDLDNIYGNYYKFVALYVNRIKECGATPVGILDCDNLEIYDGIIIPGGNKITLNHYKVIDYCIKNNLPCLGICMGMQAMVLYDYLSFECLKVNKNYVLNDLILKYNSLIKEGNYILKKLDNHGGQLSYSIVIPTYDNVIASKHSINIINNSYLYDIYKKNSIDVISMHNYGYDGDLHYFEILAKSDDSIIEAIKYKNIIGIQFHVEVLNDNKILIDFIEKCKN